MFLIITATTYRVRRLQHVILMINVGDPSPSLDFYSIFFSKKILPKIHVIFSDLGWNTSTTRGVHVASLNNTGVTTRFNGTNAANNVWRRF